MPYVHAGRGATRGVAGLGADDRHMQGLLSSSVHPISSKQTNVIHVRRACKAYRERERERERKRERKSARARANERP